MFYSLSLIVSLPCSLSDNLVFLILVVCHMSRQVSDHLFHGGTGGGVRFCHITADISRQPLSRSILLSNVFSDWE